MRRGRRVAHSLTRIRATDDLDKPASKPENDDFESLFARELKKRGVEGPGSGETVVG